MSGRTYTLLFIADLLKVPMDRRETCLREITLGLEFADVADADLEGGFIWTDDGDPSCSLIDDKGVEWLKLEVTDV